MNLPSLKQLQYLVCLHEHLHFGRAADACNVTQSTLSAGLKELEAALGAKLVERTRRVTVFTPLGVRAAARARDLLWRARELADLARATGAPLTGRLRLSVIPTIAPFLLPNILPALANAYPDLDIEVQEEMSQAGCEALSRGSRDCQILALPYPCGEVDHAALFDDPIVVALRDDDPLARLDIIAPEALPAQRMLLLEDGHCLRDHALGVCGRPDIGHKTMRGASIHTLIQLVHAGMGLSLLPAMALAAGAAERTRVITRPLDAPEAKRAIVLAWRRNCPRGEEFALLASKIRQIQALDSAAPALEPIA
jgi:LysR family hydrogen peroxide-inducible transcriptional activator